MLKQMRSFIPENSARMHKRAPTFAAIVFVTALAATLTGQNPSPAASPSQSILDYIKQTWSVLTRSNRDLAKAAVDPKFKPLPDAAGRCMSLRATIFRK